MASEELPRFARAGEDPYVVSLRREIDRCDERLLRAIKRRRRIVLRLLRYKAKEGYLLEDRDRERAIVLSLLELNDERSTGVVPLPDAALTDLWGEVFLACRRQR